MEWNAATLWWLIAGALVAAELATGSFYLLMMAVGAAAGAVAAHLGLSPTAQVLSAAALGGAAVALWHRRRSQHPAAAPASHNPDVNLDIGQTVTVNAWQPDGHTQVQYRGATWQARFIGGAPASGGRHVIRGVEGACLLLDR
jgi:membrane protein implicated in regulation of membrane protease activity